MSERNLGIVGLGAIGGAVAARLLATRRPGERFGLAAGSAESAKRLRALPGFALRERGAVLRAALSEGDRLEASLPALPDGARYDWILLCTRADATEAALDAALALLSPSGALVCLQNGLPEEKVSARAGPERTLGAVIGWSATTESLGHVAITGRGGFVLGSHDPRGAPRLEGARELLARAFPARVTANLAGARWSKLALNCAISTLGAISGLSFGELGRRQDARRLALACIDEVVAIAREKNVHLSRISGLDPTWLAAPRSGTLARPLQEALFWIASRQRPGQRSGMLERLLSGRTSGQIEDLNGAVVAQAALLGKPAPLNAALLALVRAIERGEASITPENFAKL